MKDALKRALKQGLGLLPHNIDRAAAQTLRKLNLVGAAWLPWVKMRRPKSVLTGPFKGLQYASAEASGSALYPKIIGTYEQELWPIWDSFDPNPPQKILNLGAAEGFFAVGLALRWPQTRIEAIDIEPRAQALCRELARANKVEDRIHVPSNYDLKALYEPFEKIENALVLCDTEGAEDKLLDPETYPALKRMPIIVETHDGYVPGITETLKKRFEETHDITVIDSIPRTILDFPKILREQHPLSDEDCLALMNEWRMPQGWLILKPKN